MIIGIGIDAVSITRFDKLIELRGERLLRKLFSESEIEEGIKRDKHASFFAARFAAREAFVKALGTGFRQGVSLRDIGVIKDDLGKPELSFTKRVQDALRAKGITKCHLSITHDGDSAQAIVILEGA
ncbi:MAG: holo-ACP synthase [Candidatus Krumholzibacteria bacterium]|jgi:holo-[acyl-carrier protein] synthase|nr:holo-ACP synthase [Candidatus Krumholzibacteria bacterium]